jgi:hypothetical protein
MSGPFSLRLSGEEEFVIFSISSHLSLKAMGCSPVEKTRIIGTVLRERGPH